MDAYNNGGVKILYSIILPQYSEFYFYGWILSEVKGHTNL